ncbi:MAG TPA: LytTR family DNA-binding domain-containing protein [Gemmatimonadaceae bacterium]|nr:LytTR family DNA-binding domain-containing protein [Gemmatimonadaceae bacterium]
MAEPSAATPPAADPPLRVLVVDDEPYARQRLLRLLGAVRGVRVLGECGTGREALRAVEAHAPDLVFLDVAMPGVDGLEVARRLGDGAASPLVVFVTAYDEHAIEAFRIHATDYLLKPIDLARLADAVEHARRRRAERARVAAAADAERDAPRLTLRDGHRTHVVPVHEVLWIESFGNYARVYTAGARYIHRATMTTLAAQLAPHGFARIHRAVIVNTARIRQIRPKGSGQCDALLDTGVRLPVGRTYRAEVERIVAAG